MELRERERERKPGNPSRPDPSWSVIPSLPASLSSLSSSSHPLWWGRQSRGTPGSAYILNPELNSRGQVLSSSSSSTHANKSLGSVYFKPVWIKQQVKTFNKYSILILSRFSWTFYILTQAFLTHILCRFTTWENILIVGTVDTDTLENSGYPEKYSKPVNTIYTLLPAPGIELHSWE